MTRFDPYRDRRQPRFFAPIPEPVFLTCYADAITLGLPKSTLEELELYMMSGAPGGVWVGPFLDIEVEDKFRELLKSNHVVKAIFRTYHSGPIYGMPPELHKETMFKDMVVHLAKENAELRDYLQKKIEFTAPESIRIIKKDDK